MSIEVKGCLFKKVMSVCKGCKPLYICGHFVVLNASCRQDKKQVIKKNCLFSSKIIILSLFLL